MIGWRSVRLGEVADDVTVGHVGPMISEYQEAGIPFLRSLNVEPFRINTNDLRHISPNFNQRLRKSELRPGDVVIVRTGKPGTCSVIPESLPIANCSDLVIVRPSHDIDARFLMYYVNSAATGHIAAHLVGAVQQHFNVASARQLQILLPSIDEQRAIAHILGTLDEIARTLFTSWFVNFDPVRVKSEGRQPEGMDATTAALFPDRLVDSDLGLIPEGWSIGTLENIATLSKRTVRPSQHRDEFFDHYSLPSFDKGQIPARELGGQINSNKTLVVPDSVLISKLNPHIPRVWMPMLAIDIRSICSTEFLVLVPNTSIKREFLFSYLVSSRFSNDFQSRVTGTTGSHQRVTPDSLMSIQMCLPSDNLVDHFGAATKPFFDLTASNRSESIVLAELRDTLLPELLSGRIQAPVAGHLAGAVVS